MADFPFKLVGFDLDGTLLDTAGDLRVALNHALEHAGRRPVDAATARTLIGGGTRKMLGGALALTGGALPDAELTTLTEVLVAHYAANISRHTQPFPGALTALDALAASGVKLAVVTNKLEHLAVRLLDALGISRRLDVILGGDSLGKGRAKPAPDLLLEMTARAGLRSGERAAYVGDTSFDVGAARAAAMPVVAVSFGFCDAPAETLGADAVIDHFDELVPVLAGL